MNTRALLDELRTSDVRLAADGDRLRVDAPVGCLTDQMRAALVEHKPRLLELLERERRTLKEADRRGLVIRWAKERGWIALHDPTTGEWHEVRARECLPGILAAASADGRK